MTRVSIRRHILPTAPDALTCCLCRWRGACWRRLDVCLYCPSRTCTSPVCCLEPSAHSAKATFVSRNGTQGRRLTTHVQWPAAIFSPCTALTIGRCMPSTNIHRRQIGTEKTKFRNKVIRIVHLTKRIKPLFKNVMRAPCFELRVNKYNRRRNVTCRRSER